MTRIPTKLKPWFEARRRFKLSHAHTQMARELGMNPRKLGSLADGGQEPWKLPLPEFIVECYRKSFGRSEPEHVRSLEEVVQAEENRRKEKQARKAEKMVIPAGSAQSAVQPMVLPPLRAGRSVAEPWRQRAIREPCGFTRTTYPVRSLATTTKPCSRPRRIRTILIALIF